jgi:hypothetical protein
LLFAILNTRVILSISIRAKFIIFARLIEYLRFLNKSFLKLNKNNSRTKKKKHRILNKKLKPRLFVFANNKRHLTKKKIATSLNSIDKLDALEELE